MTRPLYSFVLLGAAVLLLVMNGRLLYQTLRSQRPLAEESRYQWSLAASFIRSYITDVYWELDANPKITDEEFLTLLTSRELLDSLRDSDGYWKKYRVQVCITKRAWVSALESRERLPLLIVSVLGNNGVPQEIGRFAYDGKLALPDESLNQLHYIYLW